MEPEARYALVGATVLVLLALLIGALLWLVAAGERRDDRIYRIYFTTQSLEGLQARSDVRMKGIRVGDVSGFSFSAKRPGAVEVEISLERSTPVRTSTRAVVERNLITGLASIRLMNADEVSPLLDKAPPGETDPVIAEGASQLQRVSDSLNQLAARADETMRRVDIVLSDENQAAFAETLANLRTLTRDAGGVMTQLDRTLISVGRASDDLRGVGLTLRTDVHDLALRYDALGAQATTSIRDIAGDLRQMSGDLSVLSGRAEGVLADSDMRLKVTAREIESAAQSLGQAARRLRDPRAAFFGPPEAGLGPGEPPR